MAKSVKQDVKNPTDKIQDKEKQPPAKEEVKKGYNEKNPTESQGAFKPDSST